VITVSEFTKNVLIKILGVQPHRVHVVHNGVQPSFRPVTDEDSVRQLLRRYDIHGPYFLYVGQLDPFKNILRLLEAFHILKNSVQGFQHHLVCVTPSSKSHWFFPLILRKMEELALDKEIRFLRNIPDEELPLFYNGASALLIPSLYEGFGMPALEAMACGTPVVASRACSLPEVVDDAAVLVDPFLPASIADGMEKILKDRQLRESLMERGLRRAARFSWEKTAADTVNVYKKVRSS
jgi:glycosyltransferase involved in cell wall biosynthesis